MRHNITLHACFGEECESPFRSFFAPFMSERRYCDECQKKKSQKSGEQQAAKNAPRKRPSVPRHQAKVRGRLRAGTGGSTP